MKSTTIAAIFAALLALAIVTNAAGPYEHEYEDLRDRRQKETQAALDPINRKYAAAFEQLLKRATQAGDLETGLKIQQEQKVGVAANSASPGATAQSSQNAALKTALVGATSNGTLWDWYGNNTFSGAPSHTITFLPDGTYKASYYRDVPKPYQIISHNTIKMYEDDTKVAGRTMVFEGGKKRAVAQGENHSMKLRSDVP